jgi:hypothetical protein
MTQFMPTSRRGALLPAFDHPDEQARCMVSGTGLTIAKSAENRQAMHTDKKLPCPTA